MANLNFNYLTLMFNKDSNNVILVTSSVKGEGKTIFSNLSSILTKKFKKYFDWS